MKHEVVLSDTAKEHYRSLDARARALVKRGLSDYLIHEPTRLSHSRIKKLREMDHPEYRLRLDPYRVFYDVAEGKVLVLAIVPKDRTTEWLEEHGVKSS
jgi:mRNA-degrading endonuclease RelE of RelBE toxin-antitoxin system